MVSVAVVLSGCGHLDGAEIREAVLSLLYLDQHNAEVSIFAPDIEQHHVVNHLTGEEDGSSRNVLVESARIARGAVAPLSELQVSRFGALIVPGGYGVAKNLSDFAFNGPEGSVNEDFERVIKAFHEQKKPIGAICIAPAILARVLKGSGATLTIGDDAGTAGAIEALGCVHKNAPTDGVVVDAELRVVSCAAYMRDDRLSLVAKGIEQVVSSVLEMASNLKMAG